jgi:hypothetical protein
MTKEIWALGAGESLLHYDIKRLKDKTTLGLHDVSRIYEHFGFWPTYWTWGDPTGAYKTLHDLFKMDKLPDMEIVIPDCVYPSFEEFRKRMGTTDIKDWAGYVEAVDKLIKKGMKVTIVPTASIKYLTETHDETLPDILNFKKRFSIGKMVIGTCFYPFSVLHGSAFSKEKKLTFLILPICHWLGAKKVYVTGHDGIGRRYYQPDVKEHPDPHGREVNIKCLTIWKNGKEYHGMDIISVIESKYTYNNEVLQYIPFEEALK